MILLNVVKFALSFGLGQQSGLLELLRVKRVVEGVDSFAERRKLFDEILAVFSFELRKADWVVLL